MNFEQTEAQLEKHRHAQKPQRQDTHPPELSGEISGIRKD